MVELQLNQSQEPIGLEVIRTNTEELLRQYVKEAKVYSETASTNANTTTQNLTQIISYLNRIEQLTNITVNVASGSTPSASYNQETAILSLVLPRGENGFSPEVNITPIEGGNEVSIVDAAHPDGQSFSILNAPQINDNNPGINTTYSGSKISQLNDTKVDKTLAIMIDENGRTYIDDGEDEV